MSHLYPATVFFSRVRCYLPALLLFMMLGSLLFNTAPAQQVTANSLLNKMIAMAEDNGGAGRSGDLNALKQQIEALPKMARGNRSVARTANDQALSAFNAGQYEQARQFWMAAHQADPGDVEIINNLGLAYLKAKDYSQAFNSLFTTLKMSPGRSAAWANLADYFALQDKPQQAVACYALAFHFSKNQNKTKSYLQKLAGSDDSLQVRQAAQQALDLNLIRESSDLVATAADSTNAGLNKESQTALSLPTTPPVSTSPTSIPASTPLNTPTAAATVIKTATTVGTFRDANDEPMVVVKGGCYQMGSPPADDSQGRERQHQVCVGPMEIGQYEVTVGAFQRFAKATGYRTEAEQGAGCQVWRNSQWVVDSAASWRNPGYSQTDRHPVVCVSQKDAQKYVDWLNDLSRKQYPDPEKDSRPLEERFKEYSLLTEAEWEYVARAESLMRYPWGDDAESACRYANISNTDVSCRDGADFAMRVGNYEANRYGLHDLIGNVWEWTCSAFDKEYVGRNAEYSEGQSRRCLTGGEEIDKTSAVARGGGWRSNARLFRSATRNALSPNHVNTNLGFRVGRTLYRANHLLGWVDTRFGKAFISSNFFILKEKLIPIDRDLQLHSQPLAIIDQLGRSFDILLFSEYHGNANPPGIVWMAIEEDGIRTGGLEGNSEEISPKMSSIDGYLALTIPDQHSALVDIANNLTFIEVGQTKSKDAPTFYLPQKQSALETSIATLEPQQIHVSQPNRNWVWDLKNSRLLTGTSIEPQGKPSSNPANESSRSMQDMRDGGTSNAEKSDPFTVQGVKVQLNVSTKETGESWQHWIALMDLSSGRELWRVDMSADDKTKKEHIDWPSGVNKLVPLADGKHFLVLRGTHHLDGESLELRRLKDGSLVRRFEVGSGCGEQVLALSPRDNHVYVFSWCRGSYSEALVNLLSGEVTGVVNSPLKRGSYSEPVVAAKFTTDGRYLITAETDGALRVWNFETRELVAQLYTFEQDGQTEWLAITPEGYYSASAGGARLLKVKTANGIYSIDRFAAEYDRPDIVQLALQLADSQRAIAQLSARPAPSLIALEPPKVWFEAPAEGLRTQSDQIEVVLRTEDLTSPAESIELRVNGRPVNVAEAKGKPIRPDSNTGKVKTYRQQIALVPGHNWIEAIARNQAGTLSEPRLRLIVREGEAERKPNLYYLGVGVSTHPRAPLKFPAQDVRALADTLQSQSGKAFGRVKTELLLDQSATRAHLQQALGDFFTPAQRGDLVVVFISGHGMNAPNGYHFLTYDGNPDALEQTAAPWKLFEPLYNLPAQVLLLVDTCHAGNIAGTWKQQALIDPDQFLRNAALNNVIVMASSSGQQVSLERADWGHGAFTKALLEGLQGKAADTNGIVDLALLQRYVRQRVRTLTDGLQEPRIPRLTGGGEFLELVLAR